MRIVRHWRHWDKAFAVLVFGACAWKLTRLGGLFARSVRPSDAEETVRVVDEALRTNVPARGNYSYASDPPDYSGHAAESLACNGYAGAELAAVPPHLVHPVAPRPPRGFIHGTIIRPYFLPPVLESVEAGQGKVDVVTAQNPEDMFVKILRFEIFRKEEGGAYGAEPAGVLEPDADRRAAFTDTKVEPRKRYTYKVRAVGAARLPEEDADAKAPVPGRPKGKRKIIRPEGVDEVRLGDGVSWLTPFSAEASVETPSDIELELLGILGGPDWSARIRIRRWNSELEKWDEGTFSVEEGEAVRGARVLKRPRGQKEVEFDSGCVLAKVERVKEVIEKEVPVPLTDETRKVRIEISVPRITVRETSTGDEYFIQPKEPAGRTDREASTVAAGRRSVRARR